MGEKHQNTYVSALFWLFRSLMGRTIYTSLRHHGIQRCLLAATWFLHFDRFLALVANIPIATVFSKCKFDCCQAFLAFVSIVQSTRSTFENRFLGSWCHFFWASGIKWWFTFSTRSEWIPSKFAAWFESLGLVLLGSALRLSWIPGIGFIQSGLI